MSHVDEAVPAPLRKRNLSKVAALVLAGSAGIALALANFPTTQQGDASYRYDSQVSDGEVVVSALSLGQVPYIDHNYEGAMAPPCQTQECAKANQMYAEYDAPTGTVPDSGGQAVNPAYTEFTIANTDDYSRAEVYLTGIAPVGDDSPLYDTIWVHIERQDPTLGGGANNTVYHGPLSGLGDRGTVTQGEFGLYMGELAQGATQTFEVEAWSDAQHFSDEDVDGLLTSAFEVTYKVDPKEVSSQPQP